MAGQIDADGVAILQQGDGTAFGGLGRDMPDAGAAGATREASVGD